MKAWGGTKNEVLTKKVRVKLPVANNVTVVVKQPLLKDEQDMMTDMLFQSDKNLEVGTEMLVVEKFEIDLGESKEPSVIESRDNIFRGYTSLPASDRKAINKAYIENFGEYAVKLEVFSNCSSCGNKNTNNLDLLTQFFRAMYE